MNQGGTSYETDPETPVCRAGGRSRVQRPRDDAGRLHAVERGLEPRHRETGLPGSGQGTGRRRHGQGLRRVPGVQRKTHRSRQRQPEGDEGLLQKDPCPGPRSEQGGRERLRQERALLPHQRVPGARHARGDHGRQQPSAAPRPAGRKEHLLAPQTGAEPVHRQLSGRRGMHEPPRQLPVDERGPPV